jgi:predicted dehydrogenase
MPCVAVLAYGETNDSRYTSDVKPTSKCLLSCGIGRSLGLCLDTQKPMAHSIWEARLMTQVAKEQGVATQMGNQAHAGEPIRRAVELIRSGIIGKVKEVHAWTNRPIWPQGMSSIPKAQPIPNSLDWYLWLGPAPDRPYHESYCPFKWRGWWDFGTGALGDMGCHIMDMLPFWALDLKHPTSVEAKSEGATYLSAPRASTVTYQFPAGQYSEDLKFCWYDGNKEERHMPPAEVFEGTEFDPNSAKKLDLIMIGEKGKFRTDTVQEKRDVKKRRRERDDEEKERGRETKRSYVPG